MTLHPRATTRPRVHDLRSAQETSETEIFVLLYLYQLVPGFACRTCSRSNSWEWTAGGAISCQIAAPIVCMVQQCSTRHAGLQSSGPWWWCRLSSHHVLPEQMLSSAVGRSWWSTEFHWLSPAFNVQRCRFLCWFLCHLSGHWKVFHLAGKQLCLQDPKVWVVILEFCWVVASTACARQDQSFLCRHLNLLSWTTQAMSPGHFTHASLYLCFVMPSKLSESHFCRCLRKAWIQKPADKNPRRKIQHQVPHMQNACSAWKSRNLSKIWVLLGFSNWTVRC